MIIKNSKIYDVLKYIALIFIPALTTFVGLVLRTLDVAHADVVIIIMAGFDTFLGSILQISNYNYNKNKEG